MSHMEERKVPPGHYSHFGSEEFQKAISFIEGGKYLEFVKTIGCDGGMYAECEGNLSTYTDKLTQADDDIIFDWLEKYAGDDSTRAPLPEEQGGGGGGGGGGAVGGPAAEAKEVSGNPFERIEKLTKENEELKQQNEELETRKKKFQSAYRDMRDERDNLTEENKKLKESKTSLEAKVTELALRIDKMGDTSEKDKEINALSNQVQDLESEKNRFEREKEEAENEYQKLKKQKKEEIEKLQKQIAEFEEKEKEKPVHGSGGDDDEFAVLYECKEKRRKWEERYNAISDEDVKQLAKIKKIERKLERWSKKLINFEKVTLANMKKDWDDFGRQLRQRLIIDTTQWQNWQTGDLIVWIYYLDATEPDDEPDDKKEEFSGDDSDDSNDINFIDENDKQISQKKHPYRQYCEGLKNGLKEEKFKLKYLNRISRSELQSWGVQSLPHRIELCDKIKALIDGESPKIYVSPKPVDSSYFEDATKNHFKMNDSHNNNNNRRNVSSYNQNAGDYTTQNDDDDISGGAGNDSTADAHNNTYNMQGSQSTTYTPPQTTTHTEETSNPW